MIDAKILCKINQCIDLAILVSQYGIKTSQAVLQALVLVQRTLAPVLALHHALTQRMSQSHAVSAIIVNEFSVFFPVAYSSNLASTATIGNCPVNNNSTINIGEGITLIY